MGKVDNTRWASRLWSGKKAVMFSASLVVFVITLLIFVVVIYRGTEEGETRTAVNSFTVRAQNIEDSVQYSVRKIYEARQNATFVIDNMTIDSTNYDRTAINTTMLGYGRGNANITQDLARLKAVLEAKIPGVSFDDAKLSKHLYLEREGVVKFYKEDNHSNHGERIVLYYNESGNNNNSILGVNITIDSLDSLRAINWIGSGPDAGTENIHVTINERDYPALEPEEEEGTLTASLEMIVPGMVYTMNLSNGTDFPLQVINISIDHEKIVLENFAGDYNVSIEAYVAPEGLREEFVMEKEVFNISIPDFAFLKKCDVKFN